MDYAFYALYKKLDFFEKNKQKAKPFFCDDYFEFDLILPQFKIDVIN
jgi:hypothetical protein